MDHSPRHEQERQLSLNRRQVLRRLVGAAVGGATALLAACGPAGGASGGRPQTAAERQDALQAAVQASPTAAAQAATRYLDRGAPSGTQVITYWHMWSGQWEYVVNRICTWFNATQTQYFVKPLVIAGDANAKFLSAVAGQTPPDIMTQWNQVIPTWADQGALTALDTLLAPVDRPKFQQWFWPIAWDIGNYKEHQWATPSTMNSWALMYNQDLFRQAGLDPNKPPQTLGELDSYAAKLFKKRPNGDIDIAGFIPTGIWQWGDIFGGDFYDQSAQQVTVNAPKIVAALTWMTSYSKRYDVNRISSFQQGISATVKGVSPFAAGKYAMSLEGQWVNLDMKHYSPATKYGVVPAPAPAGGRPNASWVNGNYQIIPQGVPHAEGAFRFLQFWSGYGYPSELATICTWGGWIPCGPAMTKERPYLDYLKEYPNFKPYVDIFNSPNVRITPKIPEQGYMYDQVNTAETYAEQLSKTPQQALDQAQQLTLEQIKTFAGS